MREDTQQNEHEFFAKDERSVYKFVEVNNEWIQDGKVSVTDGILKCLVLPSG